MLALSDLLWPHDQREHSERGLRERFRTGWGPGVDSHIRLGLEVLPARLARAQSCAPRSPNRAWSTATMAGPAVSVLSTRGPIPTIAQRRAPSRRARSTPSCRPWGRTETA